MSNFFSVRCFVTSSSSFLSISPQIEESYLTLADVQEMLSTRGIILYVVSNYESLSKKSAPGAPVGIQFDKTIITASKKDKEAVLDIPTGNYAKLAIATRGKSIVQELDSRFSIYIYIHIKDLVSATSTKRPPF